MVFKKSNLPLDEDGGDGSLEYSSEDERGYGGGYSKVE
jgi:hypothetical protein